MAVDLMFDPMFRDFMHTVLRVGAVCPAVTETASVCTETTQGAQGCARTALLGQSNCSAVAETASMCNATINTSKVHRDAP
eukprot:1158705-Pelagomonas_calceolata.AAC.9